MSPSPRLRALVSASLALLSSLFGCTLQRDYNPPSVDGLEPTPTAEQTSSMPLLPEGQASPACGEGGELASCPIELGRGSSCETDLDCTGLLCVAGNCQPPTCDDGRADQGEAGPDCAGPCAARCGEGVTCSDSTDCAAQLFCAQATQRCTSVSCQDGNQDGSESEIDCGGTCPGCAVGARCKLGSDCSTGVCSASTCAAATCNDAVENQDETGVDCGGVCPSCANGEPCASGADCQSAVCRGAGCAAGIALCCQAPRCDDGVRNGNEPVTDCGNAACGGCALGSPCGANAQCASGSCRAGTCRRPPCADGARNGTETDTDCGGADPACARCGVGNVCAANGDCASNSCVDGRCSDCNDRRRNGTETGVDCGGACGPCPPGQGCGTDADCQSAACQDGRCCGGLRLDCTRCARRLVSTISCNSNGTDAVANCEAFLDCLAANPALCPVRYAPGCSDEPGSVCDNTRFGGTTGPGVGLADAILGSATCEF